LRGRGLCVSTKDAREGMYVLVRSHVWRGRCVVFPARARGERTTKGPGFARAWGVLGSGEGARVMILLHARVSDHGSGPPAAPQTHGMGSMTYRWAR
jgi:hypothetical protein